MAGLDGDMAVWDAVSPTSDELGKLMRRGRRCGAWYRRLKREERNYMWLTVRVLNDSPDKRRLRSPTVLKLLAPIVGRLLQAIGGVFSLMGKAARRLVKKATRRISGIAQTWGNRSAHRWPMDEGFIRYMLVMRLPENRNPHLSRRMTE